MESISDTWIKFRMKVRFLGLWKMSFWRNLIKMFTICNIGKTTTFDSRCNFIRLQWQKITLFLLLSSFHPLWEMKDHQWFTRVWCKSNSLIFLFFEYILYLNIYYMSPKRARAPTFWGVGRFAAFYKKCWISCKIWFK